MAVQMFRPSPIEQEPKRKNRFVLEFPTELGIDSFNVMTSGKPKITHNVVEIPYMNTKNYVIGKYSWGEISVSFIDPIGPSSTQKIMEWVRLHSESATGRQGYAIGYKKNLVLKSVDGSGVEVEKWTLVGTLIKDAAFDEYDHNSDDISKVTITLQPFQCLLAV